MWNCKPLCARHWLLTTPATAATYALPMTPAWPGNKGAALRCGQLCAWGIMTALLIPLWTVAACPCAYMWLPPTAPRPRPLPAVPCRTHEPATGTCYLMGADYQLVEVPISRRIFSGTFGDPGDLSTCPAAVQQDVDLVLPTRLPIVRDGPGACCTACRQISCTAW